MSDAAAPSPAPAPAPASEPAHAPARGGEHAHGALGALTLAAIGIVFGDIGTSPLYTLHECLHSSSGVDPTRENVFGIVSLITWSITLVVTVKYLTFLMRADNDGEGGIMALLALVPARLRHASVGKVSALAILVIVGAALLFGDGIITPAISVLSAMEGLEVATPALVPYVVPLTVAVLIGLFAVQRHGTGGIGRLFGPVMVVWFVTLGVLGASHVLRDPQILGALSPHHGARFFLHNGFRGFRTLGGVVLAVTGGEALYADMGHFGRRPIRVGWLALVFPALILGYLGQGAVILRDPAAVDQPFYALLPAGPWIYPAVVLASAATVIASQALISGVFSLTHQAMRLGFFPRVRVAHTSGEAEGQIYVPLLNVGLAVSCIALVLVFRHSGRLAAAYGLAVSGTMGITSIVYYVVARQSWGWSRLRALPILILFLSFDIPFLVANSLKFFDGGYLPFAVAVVFIVVMVSWRIGRSYLVDLADARSETEAEFLARLDGELRARIDGAMVVLAAQDEKVPPVLTQILARFRVLHEHVVLTTVRTEHVPAVRDARATVTPIGRGLVRVVLRYGFMEHPDVPGDLARALAEGGAPLDLASALYVVGRETLIVSRSGRMGRLTEPIFAFLSRNVRPATEYFRIPLASVVEVGMQVDL